MDGTKQLLTVDDLFLLQGRQPGFSPNDMEYEQALKTVEALNKEKLSAMMQPQQQATVSFGSATNSEGRVFDYMVKPKGVEVQLMEPKVLNTQQGMFTMKNPTNVAPIIDPRTQQQVMGYAAEPSYGDAPAPLAGGGMMATNAPAAAPMQTPAPSPTPFPEGAVIRNKRDGKTYKIVNGQPVPVGP